MSVITVRNLPEATHRALKHRAALNGRSTEAEVRDILNQVVKPESRLKIGSELAAFGKQYGALAFTRSPASTEPAVFE